MTKQKEFYLNYIAESHYLRLNELLFSVTLGRWKETNEIHFLQC